MMVPVNTKNDVAGVRKAGSRTQDRFHAVKWARIVIARRYEDRRSRISVLCFGVDPTAARVGLNGLSGVKLICSTPRELSLHWVKANGLVTA